ncbi:D-alanine--D-alanine ligase family protein [Paramuribaculum intestinale]|jgi:D-alanine-D-alanine ligase|uniref:D-alanine--D-alanine ligase n=5 Tax=Paramuribaculum intestinale TaxID=2094151 RepID=A0A2V1J1Q8_9BACT|nr:D-alanine--D-alanine ligase family protein [Paramuribaculum intestinale]MBJ2186909.1 D-alanine--D-alanine ligase [Muribaculaceae bacterium]ROS92651.1 D-alanine--D-alanine ligase [Muribaculaceae bacterium Isolate-043 (Harlan)]ROT15413.1 D-alanine--D-alanine ligase [Muribaculaceae bacterium Isolate-105 (HZI)]MCX4330358.1 D-alanine--D-alanine ligase [Paramuribaculum intestinale]PWB09129.1 D-alanine--D-alanine ligase [Paramuribaculum intestinale]
MKTNIGVFFGGRSTEHEISVISASQAMAAIDRDVYDVTPVYITKEGRWFTGEALTEVSNYRDPKKLLQQCSEVYMRPAYGDSNLYLARRKMFGTDVAAHIDVAIPVLHGANGEDGTIQGLFDLIGLPFAGCDVLASANGMDKITMKMILQACEVPVVDYVWFTDKEWFDNRQEVVDRIESKIGYPVIVKPSNLGSSVGIGRAADRERLVQCVTDATSYSSRIIVEHMVDNLKEINCSVLGDCDEYQTSVCEEPIKSGEILSYEDKYMGGSKGSKGMQASAKRIPADLPEATSDRIRFLAGETFRVLSCHGVSRVDVIMDEDNGQIYVNEINTIPGSLSFYLWEASGIPFAELMDRLVKLALKRDRQRQRKTTTYDANIFAMGGGVKGAKGVK